MTKEQLQLEINKLNRKIRVSDNSIANYKKNIKELENAYSKANSLKIAYQDTIQKYYNRVVNATNKLNRESIFGEYYKSKISHIINGNENYIIQESIETGKKDILNKIDIFEEKISYEQRQINYNKNRIKQLKQQLSIAI